MAGNDIKIDNKSFDKLVYSDPYARLTYFVVLLVIMVDAYLGIFIDLTQLSVFIATTSAAAAYNFLPLLFSNKLRWMTVAMFTNGFHVFIIGVFLIFHTDIISPYLLLLPILISTAIFNDGKRGLIITGLNAPLVIVIAGLAQGASSADEYLAIALAATLMLALSVFLERYTNADRVLRENIIGISQKAEIGREQMASLINSMPQAVAAIAADGTIQLYNGAFLGLVDANTISESAKIQELLPLMKNGESYDPIAAAAKSHQLVQSSDAKLKLGDEFIAVDISVAPVYVASVSAGGNRGYIVVARDITKQKTLEEQRDEFISVVSHELRTPIAIAEGNISTAMLPNIMSTKDQSKELMEESHKQVLYLADLVNDITTLAHAERASLADDLEPVSLNPLLDELHQSYREQAEDKGLVLLLDISVAKAVVVRSNRSRLKEILQDFITNAVKYTQEGSVTIGARYEDSAKTKIRISISDTGIGLSTSDKNHVFDKFWRSEDYRTRSSSGTGLGLYIALTLADLIKAKIGVHSKLNEGSEFYVIVPVAEEF